MHDSFLTQAIFCSVPHNHLRELTFRHFDNKFYILCFIVLVLFCLYDLFTIRNILANHISPLVIMPFVILNAFLIFLYKSLVSCSIILLGMVHCFKFSMGFQDSIFKLFVSIYSVAFEIFCQIRRFYGLHLECLDTSTQ